MFPMIFYVRVINKYLFILQTLVPRVLGFSRIFCADLNHVPGVRSLQQTVGCVWLWLLADLIPDQCLRTLAASEW